MEATKGISGPFFFFQLQTHHLKHFVTRDLERECICLSLQDIVRRSVTVAVFAFLAVAFILWVSSVKSLCLQTSAPTKETLRLHSPSNLS